MFSAALLVLYGSKTLARGFSPPIPPVTVALMEPQMEEELTMTLVFFFLSSGRKCLLTRKGPTTFAAKIAVYASPDLDRQNRSSVSAACSHGCIS